VAARPDRGSFALLTAGCASSGTTASGGAPSPSTPSPSAPAAAGSSPTPALCDEAAALFTSLNRLTHIKVHKGMKDDITANLTTVKSNLTAFVTEARGQWHAQTAGLKSALTKLQTEVKSLTASPSVSALASVATAIGGSAPRRRISWPWYRRAVPPRPPPRAAERQPDSAVSARRLPGATGLR
jgi:hypothetical protein